MYYEEIEILLTQASTEISKRNFIEAERVCNTSLAEISLNLMTKDGKEVSARDNALLRTRALRILSQSLWQRGMATEAFPIAEDALAIAQESKNAEEEAKALGSIGLMYSDRSDYPRALEYLAKALTMHEEAGNRRSAAGELHNIGKAYAGLSNYDKALEFYQKALAINEEIGNKAWLANNFMNIGIVYGYRSEHSRELEYFEKSLAIYEELGLKTDAARTTGNIGIVYSSLSDYPRALEYYTKAQAAYEEVGDKHSAAGINVNIGIVYHNLSDYPLALEYYTKALAAKEEVGDKHSAAIVMGNIGSVYKRLSDYPHALEHYAKALEVQNAVGDKYGVAGNLHNIGSVYEGLSDYSKALEYYQKALAINREIGNRAWLALNLSGIGTSYKSISDYPRALEYYAAALVVHEEVGDKHGAAGIIGNIGSVYALLTDYPRALEYYSKAIAAHEEIGNKAGAAAVTGGIGEIYADKNFNGYNPEIAEEYLLKAITMSKELGVKNYADFKAIAKLYREQERWEEADRHFQKYHELYFEVQSGEATKQAQLMEDRRLIEEAERDHQIKLARFQEQEKILHNILPAQIAERMVAGEKMIAEMHESVSVFFSDIVGFTKISQKVSAQELVGMLNGIFSQFDQLARKYGLEKIKTIGDSYMAVAGAPVSQEDHAQRVALFALEVVEVMYNYRTHPGEKLDVRIGLHSGSVVAGVIGENKFAYDLWGDAVNTASRMESHGEAGKIHVSEDFVRELQSSVIPKEIGVVFIGRGEIEVKGKGIMRTYFLEKA